MILFVLRGTITISLLTGPCVGMVRRGASFPTRLAAAVATAALALRNGAT
jgi:hypothetical protein